MSSDSDLNSFVSLSSLAKRFANYEGYFQAVPALLSPDADTSEIYKDLKRSQDKRLILKVQIKRVEMRKHVFSQVIMVNDISELVNSQKSKLKGTYSKQLTASLCHEVLTPLNCINNTSTILGETSSSIIKECRR